MFGKRKKDRDDAADETQAADLVAEDASSDDADEFEDAVDYELGPYDYEDDEDLAGRLDLGSVILPMPEGGQLQVEMGQDGKPQGVHLVIGDQGRITVAAYAAPKSPGQWREVTADLAKSIRDDNGTVSIETGPWGRELVASTAAADIRFIGVDGYRWMVRLVAAGPAGSVVEGMPLVEAARAILRETIVRRGTDPHPVRTPLPVNLPKEMADQLAAAHQQQLAAAEAAQRAATEPVQPQAPPPAPKAPRRGADGSAMQQLRK